MKTKARQKILVSCTTCDKEFYRAPSKVEKAKNSFCSTKCAIAWHASGRTMTPLKDRAVTLQVVANELGVSRERVRQIEEAALAKLRALFAQRGIHSTKEV